MKILWITNMPLPEHCRLLNLPPSNLGGWLSGLLDVLRRDAGLEIAIASSVGPGCNFSATKNDNVVFYAVPCRDMQKCDPRVVELYRKIGEEWRPDVVHFHGSEFFHGLLAVKRVFAAPALLSIQGILSGCLPWCCGNLSDGELTLSLKDRVLGRSFRRKKRRWERNAARERLIWRHVDGFGGRTEWDRAYAQTLNPKGRYFYLPELLRPEFYSAEGLWQREKAIPYAIFCNLSADPLKGAHLMLRAAAELKRKFPIKLFALGNKPPVGALRNFVIGNSYHAYLGKLIRTLGLEEDIQWLGGLTASGMREQFRRCNVYAHASLIENSSNAICEAQISGCPTVAFACGGTPSLISSGETGLLASHGDFYDLSAKIEKVLTDSGLAEKISENGRVCALERHDRRAAAQYTLDAYRSLVASACTSPRQME